MYHTARTFIVMKTHSLQHAPVVAHGGRMNSHVNGALDRVPLAAISSSTRQNISAAFSPFVKIRLPSRSPGTTPTQTLQLVIVWSGRCCSGTKSVTALICSGRNRTEPNRTRHRIFAFVSLLFGNL